MDVIKSFAKDQSAAEEGKWFALGADARIKMRSLSSSASKAYRRKAMAPYTAFLNAGKQLPEGVEEDITKDQIVDVIILDWEGLEADGEDLPYSVENARMLVNEAEDFVDLLVQILIGSDSFKAETRQDEEKN